MPADLEALVELGVSASVIESPISDLKLDAIGVSREKMLGRITGAMRFAAEHGIHAAFFGVDSTRAQPDFYEQVYKRAVEAGAKEVAVVDTLGIASPEAVAELVGRTVEWVGPDVPVHFHGHNDFGLATAAAVAAVRAGARWVHGTINGMGERAGNANLGEVALALRALYGVESDLRLERAREVSERVRELSGYALEPWKPVTGETLFRRESGAVASQFHDPPSIEPYSSELVAAERGIVLGKKSGLDSIRIKAEELGLDLPEERQRRGARAVKELGTRKRGLVSDEEFRELREWLTRSSSAAGSTRSPARRCSPAAAGTSACSSARKLGGCIRTAALTEPGLPARRLQRVAPALGRRRRACRARRRARHARARVSEHRPPDRDADARRRGDFPAALDRGQCRRARAGVGGRGRVLLPERRPRVRRARYRAVVP